VAHRRRDVLDAIGRRLDVLEVVDDADPRARAGRPDRGDCAVASVVRRSRSPGACTP